MASPEWSSVTVPAAKVYNCYNAGTMTGPSILAGVAAILDRYTCGQRTHDATDFTGITTVHFNHSGIDAARNNGIRSPTHNTGGTR